MGFRSLGFGGSGLVCSSHPGSFLGLLGIPQFEETPYNNTAAAQVPANDNKSIHDVHKRKNKTEQKKQMNIIKTSLRTRLQIITQIVINNNKNKSKHN